jgi:hypothetical protein
MYFVGAPEVTVNDAKLAFDPDVIGGIPLGVPTLPLWISASGEGTHTARADRPCTDRVPTGGVLNPRYIGVTNSSRKVSTTYRKVSTENVRGTYLLNIQNVNFRPDKNSLSSPLQLVD